MHIILIIRIGAHAYSLLEKEDIYPNGLILEAPFTRMSDEIREYPLTKVNYYYYKKWMYFFYNYNYNYIIYKQMYDIIFILFMDFK